MKTFMMVVIVIVGLFMFSNELFGIDAKKTLKEEGVIGVATSVLFGKEGFSK